MGTRDPPGSAVGGLPRKTGGRRFPPPEHAAEPRLREARCRCFSCFSVQSEEPFFLLVKHFRDSTNIMNAYSLLMAEKVKIFSRGDAKTMMAQNQSE